MSPIPKAEQQSAHGTTRLRLPLPLAEKEDRNARPLATDSGRVVGPKIDSFQDAPSYTLELGSILIVSSFQNTVVLVSWTILLGPHNLTRWARVIAGESLPLPSLLHSSSEPVGRRCMPYHSMPCHGQRIPVVVVVVVRLLSFLRAPGRVGRGEGELMIMRVGRRGLLLDSAALMP